MRKLKSLLVVGMAAACMFNMAGCDGTSGGGYGGGAPGGNGGGGNVVAGGDVADVNTPLEGGVTFDNFLDRLSEFTEATYSFTVNSDDTSAMSLNGKFKGDSFSLNEMSYDEAGNTVALKDFIIVTDDKFYINIDSFSTGADPVGSYGIVKPDVDAGKAALAKASVKTFINGVMSAATSELEIVTDETSASFTISNVAELRAFYDNAFNYIIDNEGAIDNILQNSSAAIDLRAYMNKLVDNVYDDLAATYKEMHGEDMLSKDDIKAKIEESVTPVENGTSGSLIKDAIVTVREQFASMSDDDLAAIFGEGSSITFRVEVVDTTLSLIIDADIKSASGDSKTTIRFDVTKAEVDIKAPEKIATTKDVYAMLVAFIPVSDGNTTKYPVKGNTVDESGSEGDTTYGSAFGSSTETN